MAGWLERLRGNQTSADDIDDTENNYDETQEQEEGEEEDPLAHLDDATRSAVEELIAQREYEVQENIRGSIGQVGFDLGMDGRAVIADPNRLASFINQQQQPATPQPAAQNNYVQQEQEEVPDYYADPKAFAEWQRREMEKIVAPLKAENQAMRAQLSRLGSATVQPTIADAVAQFAPWLGEMVELPQFQQAMRSALSELPPDQYEDPADLARVASMVAVGIGQQQRALRAPRPVPATPGAAGGGLERDPQTGRFRPAGARPQPTPRLAAREAANRAALVSGGPSRDAGRQPRGQEVTDLHRTLARLQGISVEEAALLAQDTTGDAAQVLRAKRLQEMR